ncbi:FtsP/CotA-like multicopper oxidase with cupredoxin domain [Pacificimonas flava]|uniref:Multicopper oxidase n=2 Tax=Pacificimonas flava TaxID=1234595 RepID=M2TNQ4_9SPHN|nr:Multicopper oxidase [Pacificimonas flava]MBB5279095.1 FtsP/CotA-like multicopper oxidase with cupredoxin domain [Pacificimonas flava]
MNVRSELVEIATLHWHGFHLPAAADGGPHQPVAPGETWSPAFEVRQRASLFWYHSHAHQRAGPQVYAGLAGAIYVRDDESERLDLPNEYGVDDIPLVVQDRAFSSDGSFVYSASMHSRMMGARGDTLLVNGTVDSVFEAASDRLRLRVLNGSNARFYSFSFSDARSFHLIASDGGLLERPLHSKSVLLAPGERAQIVVDLSDGRAAELRARSAGNMGMGGGMMGRGMMGRERLDGGMGGGSDFGVLDILPGISRRRGASLPRQLVSLPAADASVAVRQRRFVLDMGMGMMGGFTINGKSMDMQRIDERVPMNEWEIWQIENASMMAHPFHIHDVQFRILDRDGKPPPAGEQGLKDTVVVNSRESVRLLLRFEDYADPDLPYMYHCHILEHEDAGMMGQFVVTR